jgi:signal transduction histidine kinase/DNA-binding NarL/FixJ family response regulator
MTAASPAGAAGTTPAAHRSIGIDQLTRDEAAGVHASADEALATQSIPGLVGHWVLAAVILGTTSLARTHPLWLAAAAAWSILVGACRLRVARSYARLHASSPALWSRLFSVGLLVSSLTWGLGGAGLLLADSADGDALLILMTLAGISAGGLTSLSANRGLLRLHVGAVLLPLLAVGWRLPGTTQHLVGFYIVVACYLAFLVVQGKYANEVFISGLVTRKLLERHAKELEAAHSESVEASRVKSEFLANMSHEIRTPMTAVIGYADLLLDPSLNASERVNHVQTIRRNGEHLMAVINDILDISKIEAGKLTVESIQTSPSQIVADVASLMRVRAVEKGLSFDIRYDGAIPETISSDPTRLRQILMNFVGNAIKFTERGGVRIVVRCEGSTGVSPRLVVDVIDTGIGMTTDQLDRVFASFSQADTSTTRRFGGSGLGLVISKRLATLLGGDVHVESAPGAGSTFRTSVPTGSLAGVPMLDGVAEAALPETPHSIRRVPSLPPACRILLADDGYDNQVLISTYLVKSGAKVKVVPDGRQAVAEAAAAASAGNPYAVILMDMQMPELDGYGATSKLRQMGYSGPIIALTAHAMAGDRERCESAGCDEYLTKPVDRAKLVATVARFLGPRGGALDEALVSVFMDDEDMKEIVHQFVRDLPDRSSAILRAYQSSDIATLRRLVHQLKGAAGGYGFPKITEVAGVVEAAIVEGQDPSTVRPKVEELASLCRRARAA